MRAKLGMSPIAWWNDDLVELSDDVSLEECLRQSRSAGFTGMEKGRRFPDDPDVMLPILKRADVTLCGGWFSGTLVNEDMAANKDRIQPMIDLFKAVDAPCIVYGEVGRSIQGDRSRPLDGKPPVSGADYWRADFGWHLAGIFGGFVWCAGAVSNFVASQAHVNIGPAVSYSIGQGATMVSALWGVFVWREFAGATRTAKVLLAFMFVFFLLGLGAIAMAPLY